MPRIVVTAQVEDSTDWERSFRTHGKLFGEYSATAVSFTATQDNEVVICFDVEDLQTYLEQMGSPDTEAAMTQDGVKRETVKVFVLNRAIGL